MGYTEESIVEGGKTRCKGVGLGDNQVISCARRVRTQESIEFQGNGRCSLDARKKEIT